MTCFWDGIMKSLNKNDFDLINEKKSSNSELIAMLKRLTFYGKIKNYPKMK